MADTKISALTNGNPALTTDEIPVNRSGSNVKVTVGSIQAGVVIPPSPVTSVAGKTGDVTLAEADIANLTTDLASKQSRLTGTGLARNGGACSELSGDVVTNGSNATVMKNTGTPGTYPKVTTDAQGRVTAGAALSASDIPTAPCTTQTGNYVAALSDANGTVPMNVASANTFTVPPNSSVAFLVGTVLNVIQLGAGQTTLTPGAGVTINTPQSLITRAQYATVTLIQVAANVWVAAGDLL